MSTLVTDKVNLKMPSPSIVTLLEPFKNVETKEMESSLPATSLPDYDMKSCQYYFEHKISLTSGYSGDNYEQLKAVINHALLSITRSISAADFKTALSKIKCKDDMNTFFAEMSKKDAVYCCIALQLAKECLSTDKPINANSLQLIINSWIDTAKAIIKKPQYLDIKIDKLSKACKVSDLPLLDLHGERITSFEERFLCCYHQKSTLPFQVFCSAKGTGKTVMAHSLASGKFPSIYFIFPKLWLLEERQIQKGYKPFIGLSKIFCVLAELDLKDAKSTSFNERHKWHLAGFFVAIFDRLLELKTKYPIKSWLELQCRLDHIKFTKMSVEEAMKRLDEIKLQFGGPIRILVDDIEVKSEEDRRRYIFIRWLIWFLRLLMIIVTTDVQVAKMPREAIDTIC